MTFFLNFRSQNVGGPVVEPRLLEGDGTMVPPTLSIVDAAQIGRLFSGQNVLFAAHGFNVNYQDGACELGQLGAYLDLPTPSLFIGILWPGDCWLPVVDYPFEGNVAIDCGGRLALFCEQFCASAQSISFVSHSLGARLILEAVSRVTLPIRSVCLTAAAINRDCLTSEYASAAGKAERISVLASESDEVLKVAFSIGDPLSDLLRPDHAPFTAALGSIGPVVPPPRNVSLPWQISKNSGYSHHDYLPPSPAVAMPKPLNAKWPLPPPLNAKWPFAANFMKRAFLGKPQLWPSN